MKSRKKYRSIRKDSFTFSLMQFYHFALWLPVILPVVMWSFGHYPVDRKFINNTPFPVFANLIIFGVVQYTVFALWTLYKYRGASSLLLRQISFTIPMSFAPFYAIGFLLAYMLSSFTMIGIDTVLIALVLGLISIPVGYCYVISVRILEWVLIKTGFINREFL